MHRQNFNTELLEVIENELRISHRLIAEQTQNKERSISKLITTHFDKLELFGVVRFEIAPRKDGLSNGDLPKTYFLNEPQATLLLTFIYLLNIDWLDLVLS